MEIVDYKPINKNAVQGKFNLKMPKWGNLIIRELTYFKTANKRWISFPSRQYEKDGEKKYYSFMMFETLETANLFQEKLLTVLDQYLATHPEAMVLKSDPESTFEGVPF